MFFNKVLLASKSPRRRELLVQIFNNVMFLEGAFDEPKWPKGVAALDYLVTCVETKWAGARAAALANPPQERPFGLIVADTIVVLGRDVLGKPDSPAHARQMLENLSGRTHFVFTGVKVGLFSNVEEKMSELSKFFSVKTEVEFHKLGADEIARYVRGREPMDKAGSYGFQDRALKFVKRVKGSYLNVVGLPVAEIEQVARELGFSESASD